jgi:hypothetical protein
MNNEQSIDLDNHLETELKELENLEKNATWDYDNLIAASKVDLQLVSEGLNSDDAQTKAFCEFFAAASVFASKDYKDKLSCIPEMAQKTKDLINAVLTEVKEFSEIANDFNAIIIYFNKLIFELQSNLSKSLPYLEKTTTFLEMYIDAQKPGVEGTLSNVDRNDINFSLDQLINNVNDVKEISEKFELGMML